MTFKWFAMGNSIGDKMYFIVEDNFDTAKAVRGEMSEDALGGAVVAQAQSEKWAATITAALNVSVALNQGRQLTN